MLLEAAADAERGGRSVRILVLRLTLATQRPALSNTISKILSLAPDQVAKTRGDTQLFYAVYAFSLKSLVICFAHFLLNLHFVERQRGECCLHVS